MDRIFHLGSHSFLDTMFLSLFFWDFPRPTHILKKKKKIMISDYLKVRLFQYYRSCLSLEA